MRSSRCRALFATHYHELTALAEKLPSVANATIEIKEWQDSIIFLHKVIPGSADRSYGIQVAKLAGLPPSVIARANEVLTVLEASGQKPSPEKLLDDLPLFSAARRSESVKAAVCCRQVSGARACFGDAAVSLAALTCTALTGRNRAERRQSR